MSELKKPLAAEHRRSLEGITAKLIGRVPILARLDERLDGVASGATVALVLRVAGLGLGFLFNVVLARLVGAEGAGVYYQALAIVSFATVISRLGLDYTLLRFVAAHAAQGQWELVHSVSLTSLLAASLAAVIISGTVVIGAPFIATTFFSDATLIAPLRLFSLVILPLTLTILYSSMLRAVERITESMIVAGIVTPLVGLILLLVLAKPLSVIGITAAHTAGVAVTLIVAVLLWRNATPQPGVIASKDQFDSRTLFAATWPLLGVALLNNIREQTDVVLLGYFSDNASVGIYGAAKRLTTLATLLQSAVNMVIAPKFAALYAQGRREELARLVRNMTSVMTILAFPMLLLFIGGAEQLLGLFGDEFKSGTAALMVLASGQLVNLMTGTVGYLLIMTGYEKASRNSLLAATGTAIVAGSLLVPHYGPLGAAIATALSTIFAGALYVGIAYEKLSIWMLPNPLKWGKCVRRD